MTRDQAIELARHYAYARRPDHAYLTPEAGEAFMPHEWVIEAVMAAAKNEKLIELADELDAELDSGAKWTKTQHTCCSVAGALREIAAGAPAPEPSLGPSNSLPLLQELVEKADGLIDHLKATGRLRPCFNLPALDAARARLALEHLHLRKQWAAE